MILNFAFCKLILYFDWNFKIRNGIRISWFYSQRKNKKLGFLRKCNCFITRKKIQIIMLTVFPLLHIKFIKLIIDIDMSSFPNKPFRQILTWLLRVSIIIVRMETAYIVWMSCLQYKDIYWLFVTFMYECNGKIVICNKALHSDGNVSTFL